MPTREEMMTLAEDIVGSYADRVAGIAELKDTVKTELRELRTHLAELRDSRIAVGKEMRADLARSVANRNGEVGSMLSDFSAELKELNSARTVMSKGLRADLIRGVTSRKRDVGNMRKGFDAELKEIRSELAGGRDEWQILTATMQAHRGGTPIAVKPSAEKAALSGRVFEYLANHPDGTKMTELEQEFGLARIQMAKLLGSLMDANKVEKRELLYFAV